jgi:hypothetical protein
LKHCRLSTQDAVLPIPNLVPATKPYYLEVVALGLRELNTFIKLTKVQVDFELPAIKDNVKKKFSTLGSNFPSAENPNFLSVLKIPVDLPTNALFAPVMDMTIRDYVLGGLIKRNIGSRAFVFPFLLLRFCSCSTKISDTYSS